MRANGDMSAIDQAVAAMAAARAVVVITGAGMSAESGVPTFRGPGGLWRSYRPEQLASPEAFARDPKLVWEWYWWRRRRIAQATPNDGHLVLARLEQRLPDSLLLTQNVDGLHRRAGSQRLIELHGNIWRARCVREPDRVFDQAADEIPAEADAAALPRCPCGELLRPDIVWFGESLDEEAIHRSVSKVRACNVLLVVGTSAVVYPVAALPELASRAGATVIEINIDDTPLTAEADIVLRGPSGVVLPDLERRL